jgi:hypothetical protein
MYYVSSSAPNSKNPDWGDYHFVKNLVEAISRHGEEVKVIGLPFLEQCKDEIPVVIRVCGPHLPDPVPNAFNVVWIISHPELAIPKILDEFDLIFVASAPMKDMLEEKLSVPLFYLPQATPWAKTHLSSPLKNRMKKAIFVGNARGDIPREIVQHTLAAGLDVDVIGRHWKNLIQSKHILAERIENKFLPNLYQRYLVALNDHWDTMKDWGFVNNRVYDVMACGAIAICDTVEISDPRLNSLIYQVRNPAEIKAAYEEILELPKENIIERQARAKQILADTYSFDIVASKIIREVKNFKKNKTEKKFRKKNVQLPYPRIVFCDWLDQENNSNNEIGVGMSPIIRFAGHEYALPCELEEGDVVALAKRIVRISERIINFKTSPAIKLELEVLCQQEIFKASRIPINSMTAYYRETVRIMVATLGNPTRSDKLRITELFHIARRYLARQAYIHKSENPLSHRAPQDLAERRCNDLFSYPAFNIKTFDRNYFKPYVYMPGLSQDNFQNCQKVAAVIHSFYPDILPSILNRIRFFRDKPVFISTDSVPKSNIVKEMIVEFGFSKAEIRVFPNIGRDIYPKIFGFSDIIPEFDIFLHLHTKRSVHLGENTWMGNILDDIVKSHGSIRRILSLFDEVKWLGCIYPRAHYGLAAHHWGLNKQIGRELLWRIGVKEIPDGGSFRFPSGSMFWMRANILQKIADLNLSPNDFQEEFGQRDGTVAHAIERILGIVPTLMGYRSVSFTGKKDSLYRKFSLRLENNEQFENQACSIFA